MKYPDDRILTLPNALTSLRLLAIPVVLLLLLEEEGVPAVGIFILASATDFLDGKLARRRGGAEPVWAAKRILISLGGALLSTRALMNSAISCVGTLKL